MPQCLVGQIVDEAEGVDTSELLSRDRPPFMGMFMVVGGLVVGGWIHRVTTELVADSMPRSGGGRGPHVVRSYRNEQRSALTKG